MREIEFRVWDKDAQQYYQPAFILGDDIWVALDNDKPFELDCIGDIYGDILVIEQYTGLKDKNGTKIYEGDILNYHYTQYDGSGCNATVIWQTSGFMLENNNNGYLGNIEVFENKPLKYEVIGNVHEEVQDE